MQTEWQLVPKIPTPEMLASVDGEADDKYPARGRAVSAWVSMLAAAPEAPHLSMTDYEARTFQDWKGMDGAIAFHLIERHANGWGDTALMMEAWLAANRLPDNAGAEPREASASGNLLASMAQINANFS